MLLGQDARWGHIGHGRLQFVFPAANNIALALHHGGETGSGDLCRIVLCLLPNLRVEHVGTFEELSFSCARHQACNRHVGGLQFIPQREREGIEKRLGAIVDRLERARHKTGDGASDEDAALTASTHLARHFLNQIEGAGEVRINDVAHGIEVLVEKAVPQAMSRVGEQSINWPAWVAA